MEVAATAVVAAIVVGIIPEKARSPPGAGTMASERVIKRRTQGRKRMCTKPSITTCPASVPVSVELCPEANSAMPNNMLARPPQTKCSKVCASWSVFTSLGKKAVAARMRIAALMKKAPLSAKKESKKLYLQASALPVGVWAKARVCTRAECRYKLCGITVAPNMPIAT